MKKPIISIFAMLLCVLVHAQNSNVVNNYDGSIDTPSPKNYSIRKFIDIPVSYQTGLPQIGIPLFTVQDSDISVPISLNYHASGVKVSEIASRVGMGWQLSVGGSITRQQRIKSDEKGYLKEDFSMAISDVVQANSNPVNLNNLKDKYRLGRSTGNNDLDLYPDVFSFSFLGYSGKFYIDQATKQPILQSFDDLKIEVFGIANEKIDKFIITDANGIKYYFGKSKDNTREAYDNEKVITFTKVSMTHGASDAGGNGTSSTYQGWMLLDIEDTKNNLVSFFYTSDDVHYFERVKDDFDVVYDRDIFKEIDFYSLKSFVRIREKYLNKIQFKKGEVRFKISDVNREDIQSGKAYKSFELYDKEGVLIKGYDLNHTYRTSTITGNQNTAYSGLGKKRLFLNKVTEYGKSGLQLNNPKYEFEYNTTMLPSRFSNSQDAWGYYNGFDNGAFLPSVFNIPSSSVDPNGFKYGRRIAPSLAKAGILEKVVYPTGGEAVYEYESNKASAPSFMTEVLTAYENPKEIKSVSFYEDSQYYNSSNQSYESEVFEIKRSYLEIKNLIKYSVDVRNEGCDPVNISVGCKFSIKLFKLNDDGTETLVTNYALAQIRKKGNIALGRYQFRAKRIGTKESPFSEFNVSFLWNEDIEDSQYNMYIGGQRVKKTFLKEGTGNIITKKYEYDLEDATTAPIKRSSGLLFSFPYFVTSSTGGINGYQNGHGYNLNEANAKSVLKAGSLSYASTSFGGYRRVTEYNETSQGDELKSVYYYSNTTDIGNFSDYLFAIPVNNEWLRGRLMQKEQYKKHGSTYTLVSKTTNKYSYMPSSEYVGGGGLALSPWESASGVNPNLFGNTRTKYLQPFFTFGSYLSGESNTEIEHRFCYVSGGVSKLENSTVINYLDNGEVKTEVNYFYDYDKHYQVKRSEQKDSEEIILKKLNYYPVDVTSTSSLGAANELSTEAYNAIVKLQQQHRKATVLQTKTYKENQILSQERTNYFEPHIGVVLPKNIQTLKDKLLLEDRLEYHSYDDKGNPTEVSKKDGTHIVYIWGYDKTQPIAKIENATLVEVASYVGNIQTKSNADNDRTIGAVGNEGALRTALNALRGVSTLLKSQITTFTYDPLIGGTSITDPRGQTMYYEYDDFNRLQFVKDKDGNILKETKYNYKN